MDMEKQEEIVARKVRTQGGVTLIEIMIVLAIIGLIMGILVGPKVIKMFKEAKSETAWMMAKEYESGYAKWMDDNEGNCPEKLEDLLKYTNKKDLKDPWGQRYIMKCGESAPAEAPNGFGVVSLGADGKEGTEDDIHSWDAKAKK
jgi:general secretion pathway protein G